MRIGLLSIICCLALAAGSLAEGDSNRILRQKKDLENIKKEVESGKKRLDSLKNEEQGVRTRISEMSQRISSNQKVTRRLNNQLNQLTSDIAAGETSLNQSQEQFDRSRRRYLGNIRQMYMSARGRNEVVPDRPNTELELNRQMAYLASLAGFDSVRVGQASILLADAGNRLNDLTGESKKVGRLKRKRESATALEKSKRRRQEKDLELLRRKETEQADLIITLVQAAREMETIVVRLEEESARRLAMSRSASGVSVFAQLQGQLLTPCRGEIVTNFGKSTDRVTGLKSFSPGVVIKGRPGGKVSAVAGGAVVYIGNLRGYGNFVIINHDDHYFTTYAGLGKMVVSKDEYVLAGTKLGTVADDGNFRFELRQGREPLDPVKWIRIDAF